MELRVVRLVYRIILLFAFLICPYTIYMQLFSDKIDWTVKKGQCPEMCVALSLWTTNIVKLFLLFSILIMFILLLCENVEVLLISFWLHLMRSQWKTIRKYSFFVLLIFFCIFVFEILFVLRTNKIWKHILKMMRKNSNLYGKCESVLLNLP